jgi:hypothetical protein
MARFNGTPSTGATASMYTIASALAGNVGNYNVVVSNAAGPTQSALEKRPCRRLCLHVWKT